MNTGDDDSNDDNSNDDDDINDDDDGDDDDINDYDHGPGSKKVRNGSCFSQLDKSPNLKICSEVTEDEKLR